MGLSASCIFQHLKEHHLLKKRAVNKMSQMLRVYQKLNCFKIPYAALFSFQLWLTAEVK